MKKIIMLILLIALSMIMVSNNPVYMLTKTNHSSITVSKKITPSKERIWKKVKGKYQYPVLEGTDEWIKLETMEEKYAACKIPDEILSELSTMELLELVLDCPMLQFITYSDSFYEGIELTRKDFNGMEELLNKDDIYSTVLEYYSTLKIPKKVNINFDEYLPDNAKDDDYGIIANNDKIMKKVEADLKVKNIVNFCITILCSKTEIASVFEVKYAKKVLNNKFNKIKHSEYRDSILTKEDLAAADWTDDAIQKKSK